MEHTWRQKNGVRTDGSEIREKGVDISPHLSLISIARDGVDPGRT